MNATCLSDLDELVLSVREPESKRLITEAVNAYRGGALRSALISTWIAVAYDINAKIRELASRGEAQAKAFVDDLNRAIEIKNIRRLQEIENSLLDAAQRDFAFLMTHETTDLKRLFDDRDLCAHPAFVTEDTLFSPSPELVRAHIAHAVEHLLAHPPVQGKSALLRLHRDLLGTSFPSDPGKVEVVMRDNYLHQTKDSVIIAIARGLLLTPLKSEREKFKGKERSIALAFAAVGKIRPDLFERDIPAFVTRTADEIAEPEFLNLLHFVAAEPRCWHWMSEPARIRMLESLAKHPLADLISSGCLNALEIDVIAQTILPRIAVLGIKEKFDIMSENPRLQFVQEALALYIASNNFRTAEERGEKLILPHTPFFTAADIGSILRGAMANKYNQILNAHDTSDILNKLFNARFDLLEQTKDSWAALYGRLAEKDMLKDYTYPALIEKFVQNGIAPPAPPPPPRKPEPEAPPSEHDDVPI